MDVYLNHKRLRLKASQLIGKGGEADIYDLGKGQALKLFKPPNHPDYQASPPAQQAAYLRLQEHQQKLRQFPQNLPDRVVKPQSLVSDRVGQRILGYTMSLLTQAKPLLHYSERSVRQMGVSAQQVTTIFQDLHQTVHALHQLGVIIGDFNDLNVLVKRDQAYIIDADSFQFGSFLCQVFTDRFVDPCLCNPQANVPQLQKMYTPESDWYALTVMLMQCLLFVHPYGGVYKPGKSDPPIPHAARSLHRISIFHPQVRYPKPALKPDILPDSLLHYFYQVFEQDLREEMPRSLLDNLQWTICLNCGLEHARGHCPSCTQSLPLPSQPQVIQGKVKVSSIFTTSGIILLATVQNGQLCWLYHEAGAFRREAGTIVLHGDLDPCLQFQLQSQSTLVAKAGQVIILTPDQSPVRLAVDPSYLVGDRQQLGFTANASHYYWLYQGQLYRNHPLTPVYIGDVLHNQTQIWVGEKFGLGLYQAGHLNTAFVFNTERWGLNDRVQLPPWQGQLIDVACTLSHDYAWLFWSIQTQGKIQHHITVINADGILVATTVLAGCETDWLTRLRGHCAVHHFLLVATDEGIVRIEPRSGQLVVTQHFPETELFVDSSCTLLPAKDGLYVIRDKTIQKLQIA